MSGMVVETYGLNKVFNNSFQAVSDLDLKVPKGSIYGFLGRNGAGKTTTMKILLGLTQPTSGSFEVFGEKFNRKKILRHVGSLIEQPSFYGHLSGRANLEIVAKIKGVGSKQVGELLEIVNLGDASKKLARSYSLGMKQRLGLAMALIGHPRLLILDEPTNGLDPAGIHDMRELICSLPSMFNTTVMVSSHILSEIEQMADVVGIINQGKIVYQGSLADLQDVGHIQLRVSDLERARTVLSSEFDIDAAPMSAHELSIPVLPDSRVEQLVHSLVAVHGIELSRVQLDRETLESIFLRLTTGGIR